MSKCDVCTDVIPMECPACKKPIEICAGVVEDHDGNVPLGAERPVVLVRLLGTVDGLSGGGADEGQMVSDLAMNEEPWPLIQSGRIEFTLPLELVQRMKVDDRVRVTISITRKEE